MSHRLDITQSIKQDQRLIMNMAMEQAFSVLQMSTLELKDWLEREIEQNPLLEITQIHSELFDPSWIPKKPTLYEHLLTEIALHFDTQEEKEIAKRFAGSLDSNGFLTLSAEEIQGEEEILAKFQRMEPLGLGACSVQEVLLIQLENQKGSALYQMVALHYDDILHQRYRKIAKSLNLDLEVVRKLIRDKLRTLNPFPGRMFEHQNTINLSADLTISKEGEIWEVEINDSSLPSFQIHQFYLDKIEKKEEITTIRRYLAAGKWLKRILEKRNKTLHQIALYLLKTQGDFLEGASHAPYPMTMKEMALALDLSESTIHRAVNHKAIATPRGLLKLRDFFTQALYTREGIISNKTAKDLLVKLIDQETEPLSDETLSKILHEQGIPCARRTIAKYRKQLKIGSASQRKMRK